MSEKIIAAMREASRRAHQTGWPECYYWQAVWWRLSAMMSRSSGPAMHSRNIMQLYRDIKNRPDHYKRKPADVTDYIHSLVEAKP